MSSLPRESEAKLKGMYEPERNHYKQGHYGSISNALLRHRESPHLDERERLGWTDAPNATYC